MAGVGIVVLAITTIIAVLLYKSKKYKAPSESETSLGGRLRTDDR